MYNVVFLATYSLLCFLCLCFRFVFYKQHMAGVHNFCPFYWYILASEYLNLLYLSCLTYMVHACMLSCFNHYWLFVTLWIVALQAPLWDFPSKNTRVGCHAFFQGIFPIQGSNQCLLRLMHWQAGSLPLVPAGKPNLYGIMFLLLSLNLMNLFLWRFLYCPGRRKE